jgi:hypothetical protein
VIEPQNRNPKGKKKKIKHKKVKITVRAQKPNKKHKRPHVVCGDAGANLGDSIYEARLYVRGKVESLGADCAEKKMTPHHLAKLAKLLKRAEIDADPKSFRRYGSKRTLYNFHVDNVDSY